MLLTIVVVVTAVLTLAVLLNDLVRIIYIYEGAYDLHAELGSHDGVPAKLDGDDSATQSWLWGVLLSSTAPLPVSRTLQATALALTSLNFLAGGVTIIVLCRRLWTRRPFARSAAVWLFALSALTLLTAWLAPWLRHRADASALADMDYSTSAAGGTVWVQLPHSSLLSPDGTALVLGVVLALAGVLYLGVRRLQRDSDGLV
ncbi:hypothetical protein FM104_15040 [Microbacterium esteraromaticum]|uniref:Uncharacterized protein n=2 Tax=Microbacterium esteraromaticum TaxID=57043 RepID=A0A1R4KQA0_9MICO|nr:hypothetical protein FM104_15040 [Microbacterium esteraromaticum]